VRTFSARDLLRIAKGQDRVARERTETAAKPTVDNRAEAVERESRRLRGLLRRRPSS
jgi:hypothetical protein